MEKLYHQEYLEELDWRRVDGVCVFNMFEGKNMTIPVMVVSESDIDYMDYVDTQEREADLIRDLRQQEIEEMCYRLTIKDLKTGKKILNLITDQITIEQNFNIEVGYDVLDIKVVLSDEYIEENGDVDWIS